MYVHCYRLGSNPEIWVVLNIHRRRRQPRIGKRGNQSNHPTSRTAKRRDGSSTCRLNRKGYHQGIRVPAQYAAIQSAPRRQYQSRLYHFPETNHPYASPHATHHSLPAAQASQPVHSRTTTPLPATRLPLPDAHSIERRHQRENQMLIRQYILGSTALRFPFSAVPNITQSPNARKQRQRTFAVASRRVSRTGRAHRGALAIPANLDYPPRETAGAKNGF
jgi:hypothetical protein